MSYNLHIHRRADFYDESGEEIAVEEWAALIERDPSLLLHEDDGWSPKSTDAVRPPSAVWTSKSGKQAYFFWTNGEVWTKNPTKAAVRKACELAFALRARVQGDELEFYKSDGSYEPSDVQPSPSVWRAAFGVEEDD
jgi:hypothetical protein